MRLLKSFLKSEEYELSEDFLLVQELINNSKNMVDLGCGTSPHYKAKVAVDKFIEPMHRKYGANKKIDVSSIENKEIKFIQADIENLPFADKTFDLAYSHHVVEHLDNPEKAMKEMMRIAKAGVIICPGILAEHIFGRYYHKWMVTFRNETIIFLEKDWDVLFGEGPYIKGGKIKCPPKCNPFDILLNEGDWYHGVHRYKALSRMLRKYWYGHHKCVETSFIWKESFKYIIIYNDGTVKHSENC